MEGWTVRHGRWHQMVGVVLLSFGIWLGGFGCGVGAAPYPAKAIDVVVPWAAGGGSDLTTRTAAEFLARKWAKPINVINKPGGTSQVGVAEVLAAPPDGYTIFAYSMPTAAVPAVQSDALFKIDDLKPLGMIQRSPLVFTVPADSPWKTMKDAMDALKKDPEAHKYGVGGVSNAAVFALGKLFESVGIDPRRPKQVVFDGGAPTLTALAGGNVAFAGQPLPESLALITAGKIRPLAITAANRMPQIPDVPTAKELGYAQFDFDTWNGFGGSPKLPDAVVKMWEEGLREAARDAAVTKKYQDMSASVEFRDSAEFKKFIGDQYQTMLALSQKLGIRK